MCLKTGRRSGDYGRQTAAAGLAAVWPRENTREAIWDAFARSQVFAAPGTRIRVRLFAGYGFAEDDRDRPDFAAYSYANGVPMGGDLDVPPKGWTPVFLICALRDADGANLDGVQKVKGRLSEPPPSLPEAPTLE